MRLVAMMVALAVVLVGSVAGCNRTVAACEDFIDAVEECEGSPDDRYDEDWCEENVDRGCEDRRYFNCLEDNLECEDGNASTTPILCEVKADATCAED